MKKFRFRLDRLLELKRSYERMKREEIGRIKSQIDQIELERKRKFEEMLEEENKFRKDGSQIHTMIYRLKYIRGLKEDIDELEMKRRRIEELLKREIEEYLKLQRERKIYDRLRERRYREYVMETERETMNFLDDVSMRKYHFNDGRGKG